MNISFLLSIFVILLIGIAIRIFHLFIVGFTVPFNLGGLFYEISLQIIKNNFVIPHFIPFYSIGGLPFAYPPIPFYIQAILIKIFSPPDFLTVNLLPPLFSILSLFSFPFLAKKVLKTKLGIFIATFAFAVMPIAFIEQIEGQGLAESLGTLTLIWYAFSLLRISEKNSRGRILFAGLILGICIMSSPGSAYAAVLTSLVFTGYMIFESINHKSALPLISCAAVGISGLIISSPYWLTVVFFHGFDIFLTPFIAQNNNSVGRFIKGILEFNIFPGAFFWRGLFYLGIFEALLRKNYILIFYSIILFFIPRETWVMCIPVGLCIGYGIEGFFFHLQFLSSFKEKAFKCGIKVIIITIIFILSYRNTTISLKKLIDSKDTDISLIQINDLKQIRNLLPINASVIVAGDSGLIEWSSAIIEREVINNHFGLEWQPSKIEKALSITTAVLKAKNTDEILNIVKDNYKDIDKVYLISDKPFFQQLKKNSSDKKTEFTPIQEYNDLTLGLISDK